MIDWIKFSTRMFEDEKIKIILSMPNGLTIIFIWFRLLAQAGKVNDNGLIYLNEDVPYTNEMLSVVFERKVEEINEALIVMSSLKMINISDNNMIQICNWEKHQNVEAMNRAKEMNKERVKKHREKKKQEENKSDENMGKGIDEDNELENTEGINDGNEFKDTEEIKNESELENTKEINDALKSSLSENGQEENNNYSFNYNKNCNDNVMDKKKKESENKENKNKTFEEEKVEKKKSKDDEIENSTDKSIETAQKLIDKFKSLQVNIKGLSIPVLEKILCIHDEKYVLLAAVKAIEKNKLDINYIKGILKNWSKNGYPEEECSFSANSTIELFKEKPKLRFNNFEARKYDYDDLEKKLLGWE